LLRADAMAAGLIVPEKLVAEAQFACGNHPLFLRMGAAVILECLTAGITDALLVRDRLRERLEPRWRMLWSSLPPTLQSALKRPNNAGVPLVVARQHRTLERLGLLLRTGDSFEHLSPGFGRWLSEESTRSQGTETDRT
jgi:hypothetical protein